MDKVNLFLLGETHGVQENPLIIYTIFKKFHFKNIALEWDKDLQEKLDEYLQTGKLDFNSIQESRDGRITSGHFAMLKKLKEEGLLEKVICFDQKLSSNNWNERDVNMAKNILEKTTQSPTLVVAGNLHTETDSISLNNKTDKNYSMGERIKKVIPNVISGRIKYLTGQFYNLGKKEFREKPKNIKLPKAQFYESSDDKYLFELPEAHIAIVPNPRTN